MRFVEKLTPPDFQAKNFTPLISPNFNSFGDKITKKLVKMEKFTPLATNFTLLPGLTGWTNSTSAYVASIHILTYGLMWLLYIYCHMARTPLGIAYLALWGF